MPKSQSNFSTKYAKVATEESESLLASEFADSQEDDEVQSESDWDSQENKESKTNDSYHGFDGELSKSIWSPKTLHILRWTGIVLLVLLIVVLKSLVRTGDPLEYDVDGYTSYNTNPQFWDRDIASWINTSVDPCENFYEFACQGWQKTNTRSWYIPAKSMFYKDLGIRRLDIMTKILEESEEPANVDPPAFIQAKDFYTKCMNLNTSTNAYNAEYQKMWDILEENGGWPMLYKPGTWDSSSFDWIKTIYLSRPLTYKGIFKIQNGFNAYDVPRLIARIKNIATKLLNSQGVTKIHEAVLEANAMQIINVQEIIYDFLENDYLTSREIQDIILSEKESEEIQVDDEHIAEIISVHMPENITQIEVTDSFKGSMSTLISRIKPETLANFLQFHMAYQTWLLLSWKYDEFEGGTVDDNFIPWDIPRRTACTMSVYQSFKYSLLQAYVKKKYPTEFSSTDDLNQVGRMFQEEVRSLEILASATEYNPSVLADLLNFDLCIQFSYWVYDDAKVQKQYEGLILGQSTFLEQAIAIRDWNIASEYGRPSVSPPLPECKWFHSLNDQHPLSDKSEKSERPKIYFPAEFIQYPFFNNKLPTVLNYARLGAILGHEISTKLIVRYSIRYAGLLSSVECSSQECRGYRPDKLWGKEDNWMNEYSKGWENIVDNVGLQLAYNAHKTTAQGISSRRSLSRNILQTLLPIGMLPASMQISMYTDEQLFFLAFAQNYCASSEVLYHESFECALTATLKNSKEFAQVWNCPVDSQMNPIPRDDDACAQF